MTSGSLRSLAVLGALAVVAMTIMYLFMVQQVTDSGSPAIAAAIQKSLRRSLADEPPAQMTMIRGADGVDAPRHYVLRLTPSPAVATDERASSRILARAAELALTQIGTRKSIVTITCVATLANGREVRRTFDAELEDIDEPGAVSRVPAKR